MNLVNAAAGQKSARGMGRERGDQRAFFGISALVFGVSTAVTTVWCASMSAMDGTPMLGGWTLSRTWMPMTGETWFDTTAAFIGMWIVMMVAMMLPSLTPTLWRYYQAVGKQNAKRCGRLTTMTAAGYFFVWTLFGLIALALGSARTAVADSGARRADRDRHSRLHRRCVPVHRVEGRSTLLVSNGAWFAGSRRRGLARRRAAWPPLRRLLCRFDDNSPRPRSHGFTPHGSRRDSHHRRTPRTGRQACRSSHRRRRSRGRVGADCASRRALMTLANPYSLAHNF